MSVSKMSRSASMRLPTMAERVSFSPTLISSVATASFSFTMAMMPPCSRLSKVSRRFR